MTKWVEPSPPPRQVTEFEQALAYYLAAQFCAGCHRPFGPGKARFHIRKNQYCKLECVPEFSADWMVATGKIKHPIKTK